jgi:hypothetical protein
MPSERGQIIFNKTWRVRNVTANNIRAIVAMPSSDDLYTLDHADVLGSEAPTAQKTPTAPNRYREFADRRADQR